MASKKETDLINAYGVQEEQAAPVRETVEMTPVTPVEEKEDTPQPSMAEIARLNRTKGKEGVPVTGDGSGLTYKDNVGWLRLPVESLPTQGLYYPAGIIIRIRAARGEEIKHWSTMNDQDIENITQTDDILSYMIEKCCSVDMPGKLGNSWRDLKNVDRMYILLAIKEFTFLDGENDLMVPVSEGVDIPVTKDMIDFVNIPEKIMKFYNPDRRCFVFNINGKELCMYIPSIGVNNWIKTYASQKMALREGYDEDFIMYAPMLIEDYRKLTVQEYEEMVGYARHWGHKEWSVVSYVTTELSNASIPKVKYKDSDGKEVEIPLSFRGGLKAIFLLSDPLQSIC